MDLRDGEIIGYCLFHGDQRTVYGLQAGATVGRPESAGHWESLVTLIGTGDVPSSWNPFVKQWWVLKLSFLRETTKYAWMCIRTATWALRMVKGVSSPTF